MSQSFDQNSAVYRCSYSGWLFVRDWKIYIYIYKCTFPDCPFYPKGSHSWAEAPGKYQPIPFHLSYHQQSTRTVHYLCLRQGCWLHTQVIFRQQNALHDFAELSTEALKLCRGNFIWGLRVPWTQKVFSKFKK